MTLEDVERGRFRYVREYSKSEPFTFFRRRFVEMRGFFNDSSIGFEQNASRTLNKSLRVIRFPLGFLSGFIDYRFYIVSKFATTH